MNQRMGADVEIVEEIPDADNLPVIKPKDVYVNGTHVGLLAPGGLEVQWDGSSALQVTLRLQPRSVRFYARNPQSEG